MISVRGDEHLGLVTETPEGNGMDNPVAVPLKGVAWPPRPPVILGERPAARTCGVGGQGRGKRHFADSFSILIWEGVRVQLKLSTPSLASRFTKDWLSALLSNGPTTSRKYSFPSVT